MTEQELNFRISEKCEVPECESGGDLMKNRLIVAGLMGASLLLGALGMWFATGCFRSDEDPGVFATMRDRTSIRRFDPSREVREEDVEKILRAGMCAPTALNRQPWAFMVVRDPEKVKQLGERLPGSRIANGARLVIVVCGNRNLGLPGGRGNGAWVIDCSAASMNILLAAKALGLGAVWTGVHPGNEKVSVVREILGIPDDYVPLNLIPVGYPAENPVPKNKWKPERIHVDRW